MTGTFSVEWLADGVLLQRRTGLLTVEEAQEYAAAVKAAIAAPPSARWGSVVDTRSAPPQTEQVQHIIEQLIQSVVSHGVSRVALVSSSVVTALQQRRVTTSPGMHDPSSVAFFTDFDEALTDVRASLTHS